MEITGNGKGKYDDACTIARESVDADGAILIILGGNKGNGFSVQAPEHMLRMLPDVLATMAEAIRLDLAGKGR